MSRKELLERLTGLRVAMSWNLEPGRTPAYVHGMEEFHTDPNCPRMPDGGAVKAVPLEQAADNGLVDGCEYCTLGWCR